MLYLLGFLVKGIERDGKNAQIGADEGFNVFFCGLLVTLAQNYLTKDTKYRKCINAQASFALIQILEELFIFIHIFSEKLMIKNINY